MKRRELHIDVETFCELDLKKVGTAAYTEHESFEILLLAYAYGNEPVRLLDLARGDTIPPELERDLSDPNILKWAHNAAFELQSLTAHFGYPMDARQWRCTMVLAHSLSMPGALDKVATILGFPADRRKMGVGTRLIGKFCKLRKKPKTNEYFRTYPADDPKDFDLFGGYCIRDVEVERQIHQTLRHWDLPDKEWELWFLDQHINRTGLPIDADLIESAMALAEVAAKDITEDLKRITGLDNPTSRDQLLGWLNEQGAGFENLTKNTLTKALNDEESKLSSTVRYVIEQRLEGNKASIKKFDALDRTRVQNTKGNWVVRNCFQFAGAPRTWRWAGRIFQPQNIARGGLKPHQYDTAIEVLKSRDADMINLLYGSVNDLLTSLVRPAISAPDGHVLVVADLSSIESVVSAWVAGSEHLLQNFRNGVDSYKDYYVRFHKALTGEVISMDDVTKAQRTFAKPSCLGGIYRLGVQGLITYADGMGVAMTEEESDIAVRSFRDAYPEYPESWNNLERAAKKCIRTRDKIGVYAGPIRFRWHKPFMFMDLPSGRSLAYLRPKVELVPAPWDKKQLIENITYEGQNQYKNNAWERISTHGGKLLENCTQALARDILAEGLTHASNEGFTIVGHVHDEIMTVVPEGDEYLTLELLQDCMTRVPDWCPDMPLGAEGYVSKYFYKD